MRTKQILLIAAGLLALVVLIGEYRARTALDERLRGRRTEHARWQAVQREAGEQLTAALRDLAEVEQSLAAARSRLAALEAAPARMWSVRVTLLRQLLTELPAQGLPELRLLDDLDWLNVARAAELDTPNNIRAALAALRAAARMKFAKPLQDALHAFTEKSGGTLPADLRELAPYFPMSVDGMLERYSLTRGGQIGARDETLITEKPTSDMILTVSLESWGMTNGPNLMPAPGESENEALQRIGAAMGGAVDADAMEAAQQYARNLSELMEKTIPRLEAELGGDDFGQRMQSAAQRFRAAHAEEKLANLGQLLPYLDDGGKFVAVIRPLFAELDYMKEHDGRRPADPAQLQRYLNRPFNAAEALSIMKVDLSPDGAHGSIGINLGAR